MISGAMLLLLGLWGGLIPFIGPYLDYSYTPASAWTYTPGRLQLEILPAAGLVLSGFIVLSTRLRLIALIGAGLGALSAVWLIVGQAISTLWTTPGPPAIGVPTGRTIVRVLEEVGFFYGLGAASLFFASLVLGRFLVVSVRDVPRILHQPELVVATGDVLAEPREMYSPELEPVVSRTTTSAPIKARFARLRGRLAQPTKKRHVSRAILLPSVAFAVVAALVVPAIVISANARRPAPAVLRFTTATSVTFAVGQAGKFTIATTDHKAQVAESGILARGLSFNYRNGTATISGTPKAGTGGKYKIVFTATSSLGQATQDAVIIVNETPYFTSSDTIWCAVFKHNNTVIRAKGYPLPRITETGTLPRGLSFRSTKLGWASIYGTPEISLWSMVTGNTGFSGPTITLTATNAAGSADQTVQFDIFGGGT